MTEERVHRRSQRRPSDGSAGLLCRGRVMYLWVLRWGVYRAGGPLRAGGRAHARN